MRKGDHKRAILALFEASGNAPHCNPEVAAALGCDIQKAAALMSYYESQGLLRCVRRVGRRGNRPLVFRSLA